MHGYLLHQPSFSNTEGSPVSRAALTGLAPYNTGYLGCKGSESFF
jgi:hypothetical protein